MQAKTGQFTKNNTLESLRGFAALYVAIGHWVLSHNDLNRFVKFSFSFGQEAVIIFFILSGFVIHASWENSTSRNLKTYFLKRIRRIYFPLLVAMMLSLIVIQPPDFPWKEFFGNLFMLQDFATGKPGVFIEGFLGNTPLWSLSYEWGFYILFPFVYPILSKNENRVVYIGTFGICCLIAYIIFHNRLLLVPAYLIIWWAGVEISDVYMRKKPLSFANLKWVFFVIGFFVLILTILCLHFKLSDQSLRPGIYPFLFLRHFLFAALFLLLICGAPQIVRTFKTILSPFQHIAPISYSIYIFHYIIWVQIDTGLAWYMDIPIKVLILLILCYIIEVKLQPIVNRIIK